MLGFNLKSEGDANIKSSQEISKCIKSRGKLKGNRSIVHVKKSNTEDISKKEGELKTSLKVFYTNSRSLGNKINELRAIASCERPDIIGISESWMKLETKQLKTEYIITGYKLYNTDRSTDKKGGGVVIYIKDSLRSCIKSEVKTYRDTETVWIEVGNDNENLILGVIYRPPNLDRLNSRIIYNEITKASRYNKCLHCWRF